MTPDTGDNSANLKPPESSAASGPGAPATAPKPSSFPWKWIIIAVLALLVIYPIVRRVLAPAPPPSSAATNQASSSNPAEDAALNQSLEHYRAGRYTESVAAAKQALGANPNSAAAYNNIAAAYMSLHMPNEAFQNIQEALRLQPDFQLAQNNRAWILREMGQPGGTPAAANAPPANAEFYVNQSLQLYQAGRYAESVAAAREALKLKPDMPEAYNNIAAGYIRLQKWDDAITAATAALGLKPDFPLAKNNLQFAVDEKRKQEASAGKKK